MVLSFWKWLRMISVSAATSKTNLTSLINKYLKVWTSVYSEKLFYGYYIIKIYIYI